MRIILVFLWVSIFAPAVLAQMSPFDGSYTVIIKIKYTSYEAGDAFYLKSLAPEGDSCAIYSRKIRKRFVPPDSCLIKNPYQNQIWEDYAKEYAEKATFFTPDHLAIVLNSHEQSCVVHYPNQYKYHPRRFGIFYQKKGQPERMLKEVPDELVFNLSTKRGRWDELIPVVVDVTDGEN